MENRIHSYGAIIVPDLQVALQALFQGVEQYLLGLSMCKHGLKPSMCAVCNMRIGVGKDPRRWGWDPSYDARTNQELMNAHDEKGQESLRKLRLGMEGAFLKPHLGTEAYKMLFREALAEDVTLRELVVGRYKLMSSGQYDTFQALWSARPSHKGERLWHPEDRVLSDLQQDGTKRVVILDDRGRMVGSQEATQRVQVNAAGDYFLLKYDGHNQKIWNPRHARYELLPDPDEAKRNLGKDLKGAFVDAGPLSSRKILQQVGEEYMMRKREPAPKVEPKGTANFVLGRPGRL
jgi:hypothetical protein